MIQRNRINPVIDRMREEEGSEYVEICKKNSRETCCYPSCPDYGRRADRFCKSSCKHSWVKDGMPVYKNDVSKICIRKGCQHHSPYATGMCTSMCQSLVDRGEGTKRNSHEDKKSDESMSSPRKKIELSYCHLHNGCVGKDCTFCEEYETDCNCNKGGPIGIHNYSENFSSTIKKMQESSKPEVVCHHDPWQMCCCFDCVCGRCSKAKTSPETNILHDFRKKIENVVSNGSALDVISENLMEFIFTKDLTKSEILMLKNLNNFVTIKLKAIEDHEKQSQINGNNGEATNTDDVSFLFLILVQIALGELCSNDTRTGLPLCVGDCSEIARLSLSGHLVNLNVYTFPKMEKNSQDMIVQCYSQGQNKEHQDHNPIDKPHKDHQKDKNKRNFHQFSSTKNCTHCLDGTCSGDLDYCHNFNCSTRSKCYCEVFLGNQTIKFDGERMVTVCFGQNWKVETQTTEVVIPVPNLGPSSWEGRSWKKAIRDGTNDYANNPNRGKRDIDETLQGNSVIVTWNQPAVEVFTSAPGSTSVLFTKSNLNFNMDCKTSTTDHVFSHDWTVSTESIFYRVYLNLTLYNSGTLVIDAVSNCPIPNCIFCSSFAKSFGCFSGPLQAVIILFFIGFAVICVLLLIILYMIIKGATASWRVNLNMPQMQMPNQTQMVQTLVLCLLIAPALGCDYGVSFPSVQNVCVDQGNGVRNCVINSQLLVEIGFPGLEACYDLVNPLTYDLLGRVSITYVSAIYKASNTLSYWTSAWNPVTYSSKSCRISGSCQDPNGCNGFGDDNDYVTLHGQSTGTVSMVPGISTCMASCGCAGCGCFFCNSACDFCRWGMAPTGPAYQILTPTGLSTQYTVDICFSDSYATNCSTKVLTSNSPVSVGKGTFTFLGSLSGDTTIFGQNSFVMNAAGTTARYGPAAAASLPVGGGIGDIQSATQSGLINPNPHSFIFDTSIGSMSDAGSGCSFQIQTSGFANAFNLYPTLPMFIGSTKWFAAGNNGIQGIQSNPGTLLGALQFVNTTFNMVITEVCPRLFSKGIQGCYLCSGGVRWTLDAYSTCAPGSCILSIGGTNGSLVSSTIYLGTSLHEYIINATINIKQGELTLSCTSGLNTFSITDGFELVDPVPIISNGTTVGYIPGFPKDLDPGIPKGFSWSLPNIIGIAVGAAVGLAVLIGLATLAGWMIFVSVSSGNAYKSISDGSKPSDPSRDEEVLLSDEEIY